MTFDCFKLINSLQVTLTWTELGYIYIYIVASHSKAMIKYILLQPRIRKCSNGTNTISSNMHDLPSTYAYIGDTIDKLRAQSLGGLNK
jgi:hypothetical protein